MCADVAVRGRLLTLIKFDMEEYQICGSCLHRRFPGGNFGTNATSRNYNSDTKSFTFDLQCLNAELKIHLSPVCTAAFIQSTMHLIKTSNIQTLFRTANYMNHFSSCWVVVSLSHESIITLQCSRIKPSSDSSTSFQHKIKTYRKVLYVHESWSVWWGGRVTACTTTSCSFLRKVLFSNRHPQHVSRLSTLRVVHWVSDLVSNTQNVKMYSYFFFFMTAGVDYSRWNYGEMFRISDGNEQQTHVSRRGVTSW